MKKVREVADVDSGDIIAVLRAQFPSPEYAFFEQVANGVGWGARRWADAVAMGIWPSRGLLLHGFEIKVDRADWKRELKNPAKAEAVYAYCDRWWIAAPKGLIGKEELPPTWGLYEVADGRKGKIIVPAPELTPAPMTKAFVAAILRRQDACIKDIIRRERLEAREEGATNGAGELAGRLARAEKHAEGLETLLRVFQEKSGVEIASWNLGNVAAAVKGLTNRSFRTAALKSLQNEKELYERRLADLTEDIVALEAAGAPPSLVIAEAGRDEDERDDGEDHGNVSVG